jgi:hypothetical protein
MLINQFISESGICSLRAADVWIEAGRFGITGTTERDVADNIWFLASRLHPHHRNSFPIEVPRHGHESLRAEPKCTVGWPVGTHHSEEKRALGGIVESDVVPIIIVPSACDRNQTSTGRSKAEGEIGGTGRSRVILQQESPGRWIVEPDSVDRVSAGPVARDRDQLRIRILGTERRLNVRGSGIVRVSEQE